MKIGEGTIHANPGKVLDCACVVGVECDGETIALRFPTIERADGKGAGIGGSRCAAPATDKFQEWLRWHGIFSPRVCNKTQKQEA